LKTGRPREGADHLRQAVKLRPHEQTWLNNLAWVLASHRDPQVRNGSEALAIAQRLCAPSRLVPPEFWDTLAAAYAESGRFDEAVTAAQTALDSIKAAPNLTAEISRRLELYRSRQPYREP